MTLDLASFFIQVKYILENNLDDAISAAEAGLDDLTFSEEIYDERGQIVQVILELVNIIKYALNLNWNEYVKWLTHDPGYVN